ncbi:MAG TPA: carotenoid oxygenase family protein [Cellvibrionaceae bacterium]|nr:carotenoid oxygenase family protein [Cellvibrionaceae bacterium]HMW72560.1 carotenoid oxygenase family protein [Cellvibrionaceae bacterium]HMY37856.1 carotenoid oxygenase family protein [Marinagarivorans sp.]HNG58493.1 carotenoid oxygenase family protein [Cellvibrionaceae bacterium]
MKRRSVLIAGASCGLSACINSDGRRIKPQDDSAIAWRKGFSGVSQAFKPVPLILKGHWPQDAYGNFYRNGPARTERAGIVLRHWFEGDGMVHRFNIDKTGVTHQSQFVATEKFLKEEAAGRFIYPSAATIIPGAYPPRNNDSLNSANTALLPWQGKLLALWEAGSAYEIDSVSLATLGVKTWRQDCAHVPFSAHPLKERDGSLWNFGYLPYLDKGKLALYRLDYRNLMVQMGVIDLQQNGYIHACAHTQDYLIFYLPPCLYEEGQTYLDSFKWRPIMGSKILLVNKRDLTPRWLDAPPGFVFHFANAWQTGSSIHVALALYQNADLMLNAMAQLRAGPKPSIDHAVLTYLKISLNTGSVALDSTEINLEFPSVDLTAEGATTIYGTHAASARQHFLHDSLVAVHLEQGLISRFCFGADTIVEEPVVLKTTQNTYLMATYFNMARQYSALTLFNAKRLADGPIAVAQLPYVIPLGFHGCFIPASA